MDKGHNNPNTRPYDDLNTIVNDKEDEEMEDGEKAEGEGSQNPTPSFPPPPRMRLPNQNPFSIPPPGFPPPGTNMPQFFANMGDPSSFRHPLHDTTSHENLPPGVFGPSTPAYVPRPDQGVVKQFDFRCAFNVNINSHNIP